MDNLRLPKQYFSYSQFSLWLKNKDGYRKRYYLNEKQIETPEMLFGKKIAKILEDKRRLRKVKRYSRSEYPIKCFLENVPVIGYIDSFDPEQKRFIEFKTGHTEWDAVRVAKHEQLPFYSLLIETAHKEVTDLCSLVWLQTRFTTIKRKFDGIQLSAQSRELELTKRFEIFPRIIKKWERKKMREKILSVAQEISNDYANFKKSN